MSVSHDIVRFFTTQEPGKKFSAGEVQKLGNFTVSQNVYAVLAMIAQPGNPLVREREGGIYQYRIRPGFDVHGWLRGIATVPPKEAKPVASPQIPSFTKTATKQSTAKAAPSKEGAGTASAVAPETAAAQVPAGRETAGAASAGADSRKVESAKEVKSTADSLNPAPAVAPKTAAAQAPCYSDVKPKAKEIGSASSDRSTSVPPTPADNNRTGEDLGQDNHRVPAQPAPAAVLAGMSQVYDSVLVDLKARRIQLDAAIEYIESVVMGRRKA